MSRQELADATNQYLYKEKKRKAPLTDNYVGKLERGVFRWPAQEYREAFRNVLGATSNSALGFFNTRTQRTASTTFPLIPKDATSTIAAPAASAWQVVQLLGGQPQQLPLMTGGATPASYSNRPDAMSVADTRSAASEQNVLQAHPSPLWDMETLAMTAAHESSEHASYASARVEDLSVEQLQERIRTAARHYATTAPSEVFCELTRVRNHAYALAERTKRPHQLSDLYVVAGQACAMLAGASYDLGYPEAAEEQARSALAYGHIAEHLSLRAFALAVQSTIAFWSGRPARGVRLAEEGLEHRSTGTAAVRLRAVGARSWALRGAYDKTREALAGAESARENSGTDPMLDEIGGEFSFGPERVALSSASAYLALEDGVTAAHSAQHVLDLCQGAPEHKRRFGVEYGARLDLVAALMLRGDLTGAEQAMRPVLDLPPARRITRLTQRAHALHAIARRPAHRKTATARNLGDMIEHFVSDTAPKLLPPAAIG